MKTIGLLGGMSWASTALYYRLLNQGINQRLGGLHSAKIAMVSVDFQPLEKFMHQGSWIECGKILVQAAARIEAAGADFLLICTNTMHKLAPTVAEAVAIRCCTSPMPRPWRSRRKASGRSVCSARN